MIDLPKAIFCNNCGKEIKDNNKYGEKICDDCYNNSVERLVCLHAREHIKNCKNCQEFIIKNGENI